LEKIETIRDDGLIEGADPTIAALTGRIDASQGQIAADMARAIDRASRNR
jgi:hypothetical protein